MTTDCRASMETLREVAERYQRGEADLLELRRALEVVCEAQGRAPGEVLDTLAISARLTAEVRAALLDEGSSVGADATDATVLDPTRAAPRDAAATRLTVSPGAAARRSPSGEAEATRLAAGGTSAGLEAEAKTGSDTGANTGTGSRSDGGWAQPERWRQTHDQPLGPGSVLKERFVLEELIGHGGMGAVYRARDRRKEEAQDSDSHVALKLLNDDFRQHPEALIALQREAKKAQTLAHPNIVIVHDFDRDGTTVFVSMELMHGQPLNAVIRERGVFGLPRNEALRLINHMARGLAFAHQEGFVHADFKPGNVFLNEGSNIKVLDFGLARAAKVSREVASGDETRFDPASLGAITPAYASPEMSHGEPAEPADDVYALACVAYELLTGRHPFVDESGHKLSAEEAAARGMRPAPVRNVPRRVNRALSRGLAFERAARFPDAGQFLDTIKEPVKLRRTVVAALLVLAVTTGASWWVTYRSSDLNVSLDSLPPQLRAAIVEGDRYMDRGNVVQAYEAYALTWHKAERRADIGSETLSDLRVIVDRRINDVIGYYLQRAREPNLDRFTAASLRLTLESLLRQDLGSREAALRNALQRLNERLAEKRPGGSSNEPQSS